ncbi:hypothetical protein SS50377_22638 [Spironucleus salmonicida]|uniref:Uncharacterized protein n=1 Tax=Spironucleus salmonicida TaxID=348837 RepID=V6LPV9_9EUKA|nr:hypothetical protein SS50377_22638 [Spironucleus salmonicida]|eukprot:EST46697.1 Hypothetical protein SS50377_13291 [Spironucleus salmonicida]
MTFFTPEKIQQVNDRFAKTFTETIVIGPSLLIQLPEEDKLSVQYQIIKFYTSRNVDKHLIRVLGEHGIVAIYSFPYLSKLQHQIPSITPIVHEDYPHRPPFSTENAQIFDKLDLVRPLPVKIDPPNSGMSHGAFFAEMQHSMKNFASDATVIDFEAFATMPQPIPSEVGAVRIRNGEITRFHGFFAPLENAAAHPHAQETFELTSIPLLISPNLPYITCQQLLKFVENSTIFAKNFDLEKRLLTKFCGRKVRVFEVQPLLFALDLAKVEGQRCAFHSSAPGHCALQDASAWANFAPSTTASV